MQTIMSSDLPILAQSNRTNRMEGGVYSCKHKKPASINRWAGFKNEVIIINR